MSAVRVKGDTVVYVLEDAWVARELARILDRESRPLVTGGRPDVGWLEDSQALFAAADKLDAAGAPR